MGYELVGTYRQFFHWGPILTLIVIFTITSATFYCDLMWWPPFQSFGGFIHLCVFFSWIITLLYNYLMSMFKGPGAVPLHWEPGDKNNCKYMQYCSLCKGYKPPRSHHCRKCGRCIMKMDHHCPWINTCCGHYNHLNFVFFLFFSPCGCVHALVIMIRSIYRAMNFNYYFYYHRDEVLVFFDVTGFFFIVFSIGLTAGVIASVWFLFFIQVKSMLKNETGIESWVISKALSRDRMGEACGFLYPYNLGWYRNLKQVFTWSGRPCSDGIFWDVIDGCSQFTLTVEQLKQKEDKRDRSIKCTIVEDYSGRFFPCSKGLCVLCCVPFSDEPRIPLQLGEQVIVTRWRRHWLYGSKLSKTEVEVCGIFKSRGMRVKEIERTANMAWSPECQYPIYLAAGTAAQQLDASFSTSAVLEIYSLDLVEATLDMPLVASVSSPCRFHKIIWDNHLSDSAHAGLESGFIVCGAENGSVLVYSAQKLIGGDSDCCVLSLSEHVGAVKALDFNCFQKNLVASGAADSEIFIWDLNKPEKPMTPGQTSQPVQEVSCVSWNRQVPHILASNFATRCVVWDLKKSEPIIKITDSMSCIRVDKVAWHPEIATQLCLSSSDDATPVIQMWDLRYATSPIKVLESHRRGVLSVAWCRRDPDLLLSCGKDNRILCWNPNSDVPNGEVVYEMATNNQWSFDVQWCPRNPGLISASTFDGHIGVYSLMGGGHPVQPSHKVAEAFNTGDLFTQQPQNQLHVTHPSEKVMLLQKPPKWFRKPIGASFAFGGQLATFGCLGKSGTSQAPTSRVVLISRVITETELISRSDHLQQAVDSGHLAEFCAMKAANSCDVVQEKLWELIKTNFNSEPRSSILKLLGYDDNELAMKVAHVTSHEDLDLLSPGVDANELVQKITQLSTQDAALTTMSASGPTSPYVGSKTPGSRDDLSDGLASRQIEVSGQLTPLVIPTEIGDSAGLMTQALLLGNFEAAVEMCLADNKMAEAILLAIAGGQDLLLRTQKKYFQRNKSNLGRLISSVVTGDWLHVVETCELDNWKQALAIVMTYSSPEEFCGLCDLLAMRLETERNGEMSGYASLCYVCSGNLSRLVEHWSRNAENCSAPLVLQDLVEKVVLLRLAVECSRGQNVNAGSMLSGRLADYASILAGQGSLAAAISYLVDSSPDVRLVQLQHRLDRAMGCPSSAADGPTPFHVIDVLPQHSHHPSSTPEPQVSHGSVSGTQACHVSQVSQLSPTAVLPHMHHAQKGHSTDSAMNEPTVSLAAGHVGSAIASPTIKGHLSHRYPVPSYSQMQAAGYVAGDGLANFHQPGHVQPVLSPECYGSYHTNHGPVIDEADRYLQSSAIQHPPLSSVRGSSHLAATSSQPDHQVSFQDHKDVTAWNDPPPINEVKKSTFIHTPERSMPVVAPLGTTGELPLTFESQQRVGQVGHDGHGNVYNPLELFSPVEHTAQVTASSNTVQRHIPQQHAVLKDIFDSLLDLCLQRAVNAQMKRKLEDVRRKLEILYDRLRVGTVHFPPTAINANEMVYWSTGFAYNAFPVPISSSVSDLLTALVSRCWWTSHCRLQSLENRAGESDFRLALSSIRRSLLPVQVLLSITTISTNQPLSQNVLLGLHQLVQGIQQQSYEYTLGVHKEMVSRGNFAETSAFMPALKVLVQVAGQLQVHVQ